MTFDQFKNSLTQSSPPEGMAPVLQSLWYDGKGDWEMAHTLAQDVHTSEGSWIHAYLHRKEGDQGNASYWYRQAGKKMPSVPLDREWEDIVREIL